MTKSCKMKNAKKTKTQNDTQKKPLTGYNLFFYDEQLKLSIEEQDHNLPKIMGAKWRNLDATSRCMYDVAARERLGACRFSLKGWKKMKQQQQQRTSRSVINDVSAFCYSDSLRKFYDITEENCVCAFEDSCSIRNREVQLLSKSCLNISTKHASTQERILSSISDTRSFLDDDFVEFVLSLPFQ